MIKFSWWHDKYSLDYDQSLELVHVKQYHCELTEMELFISQLHRIQLNNTLPWPFFHMKEVY